jgi:predicted DNA-binding WGR domain protein
MGNPKPMSESTNLPAWRTFHCTEDGAYKFWSVCVEVSQSDDAAQRVRFGRIGTVGQEQEKHFESEGAATQATEKLIQAKLAKGYVEVFGERASVRAPQPKTVQLGLFDDPAGNRDGLPAMPAPTGEPTAISEPPALLSLF